MIKRLSMWKLHDKTDAKIVKEVLLTMEGNVQSLVSIEVGLNTSLHEAAFDIVFIGMFKNSDALSEFENDKFHLKIGEQIRKLKRERVVVEYEV